MGLVSLLFSFHGRINRLQYWMGCLGASVVGIVVLMTLLVSTGLSLTTAKSGPEAAEALAGFGLILLPFSLALCWVGLALQVKRFHDRGRTGYFTLLPLAVMIPMTATVISGVLSNAPPQMLAASVQPYSMVLWLINIAFFIDLGCLPSVDGPNKYGDPPGGARSTRPQPTPAPAGAPAATSSLFGAQSAIDRAIAERAAQPALQQPRTPLATPHRRPVAVGPASGASFGRRSPR